MSYKYARRRYQDAWHAPYSGCQRPGPEQRHHSILLAGLSLAIDSITTTIIIGAHSTTITTTTIARHGTRFCVRQPFVSHLVRKYPGKYCRYAAQHVKRRDSVARCAWCTTGYSQEHAVKPGTWPCTRATSERPHTYIHTYILYIHRDPGMAVFALSTCTDCAFWQCLAPPFLGACSHCSVRRVVWTICCHSRRHRPANSACLPASIRICRSAILRISLYRVSLTDRAGICATEMLKLWIWRLTLKYF